MDPTQDTTSPPTPSQISPPGKPNVSPGIDTDVLKQEIDAAIEDTTGFNPGKQAVSPLPTPAINNSPPAPFSSPPPPPNPPSSSDTTSTPTPPVKVGLSNSKVLFIGAPLALIIFGLILFTPLPQHNSLCLPQANSECSSTLSFGPSLITRLLSRLNGSSPTSNSAISTTPPPTYSTTLDLPTPSTATGSSEFDTAGFEAELPRPDATSSPIMSPSPTPESQGIVGDYLQTNIVGPLAQAHDTQRMSDLRSTTNAIEFYQVEKGELPPAFPTKKTCIGTGIACYNLASFLVPTHIDKLPVDPLTGDQANTGYWVWAENGTINAFASGESQADIILTR